ncbi:MAG: hypothetical protein U5K51_11690 [Flavobacteriaceae bacterium]|nr:hypothetical protein [Flavobacteriaceae bacterium]
MPPACCRPAYIELRNAINAVMKRRVPVVYLGTLVSCIAVLGASFLAGERWMATTSAVALAALVGDAALMLRENVPINGVIETWTPTRYPADWESYRTRWMAIFAVRQILLGAGFVSLLAGVVFR